MKNLLFFLSILIVLSCEKKVYEDQVNVGELEGSQYLVEWKLDYNQDHPDSNLHYVPIPPIYGDGFIYTGKSLFGEPFPPAKLFKLDASTGDKIWEIEFPKFTVRHWELYEGKLLAFYANTIYCYNPENGDLMWSRNVYEQFGECMMQWFAPFNGYVYFAVSECNSPQQDYQYLARYDLETSLMDTITFHFRELGSSLTPVINKPVGTFNEQGETLLFYGLSRNDVLGTQTYMYGHNVDKNEQLWSIDNYDVEHLSNTAPLYKDKKVYFVGSKYVYCADSKTGELLWKTEFPDLIYLGNFARTDPYFYDNLIIVNADTEATAAFDINTGEVVWHKSNCAHQIEYFTEYNDLLYTVDAGDIKVIKPINGFRPFTTTEPISRYSHWKSELAINPETGQIYCGNGLYFYSFTLQE